MDKLTQKVKEMYMEYPFPNEEYNMMYGAQILRYFHKSGKSSGENFLKNANILDAGCGTGSVSIGLAKQFPNAKITAFDLCDNSLLKAKEKALTEGITNIEFIQGNILEFDLKKKFDVIFNIGVLHHLSDPQKGLVNLKKHLKPDGRLVLWLYGKHGRYRLNLNQRMLNVLFKDVQELSKKVEYTKEIITNGPQDLLKCHFNVADSKIEDDWEKSRDWILEKNEWIVDQFLHYNERTVDINDIFELLDNADLTLDKWIGVRDSIAHLIKNEEILLYFDKLSHREKLTVIDLLHKPNYYTIVARNNK